MGIFGTPYFKSHNYGTEIIATAWVIMIVAILF